MADEREYLLGTDDSELARLEFQHGVWRHVTEAALDRAGVGPGMRVLDLGCGPGFLTRDLARRVGPTGRVSALDVSPRWHEVLSATEFDAPVERVEGRIEEAELGEARFDAVVCRWVLSFLPDLDPVFAAVARALAPGGVFVVQDYNHEGVSLFPASRGFDAAIRATRTFYADAGGDAWVVARFPGAARRAGLEVTDLHPNVLGGGPESGAFRWADVFFPIFVRKYEELGLMTAEEARAFFDEWPARRNDPDTLFFSPIVVDLVMRRAT